MSAAWLAPGLSTTHAATENIARTSSEHRAVASALVGLGIELQDPGHIMEARTQPALLGKMKMEEDRGGGAPPGGRGFLRLKLSRIKVREGSGTQQGEAGNVGG